MMKLKKITNLLMAVYIPLLTFLSCTSQPKEWKLVWSDEFDQSQIDEKVWTKIPRGGSDWNRHMSYYDSLYEVKNGSVILRAINNHTQKADTAKYLTGGIYTKDKHSFGYGKLEIKAKLGSAQGYWPALWLLSQGLDWPNGGEIDIMEHLNFDDIAYQTLHTSHTLADGYVNNPQKGCIANIDKDDFNIYGIERYRDSICFFVNNQKIHTYPRIDSLADKGQFPFNDADFYLLMDSQLGGSWVGEVNPDDLPVEMSIDWVRYYEK